MTRPALQTPARPALSPLRAPFCSLCQLHIGPLASVCGACEVPRPLSLRELLRLARLVVRHWGSGRLRDLLDSYPLYRPSLRLQPCRAYERGSANYAADLVACAERAELANLYDRVRAQQGDNRRAYRS